ncbi:MAG: hypothetical protein U0807_03460 [Candidatus Binatia bacterium]
MSLPKLTRGQVREIRRARRAGVPLHVLAVDYGVSESAISRAATRQTWSEVE